MQLQQPPTRPALHLFPWCSDPAVSGEVSGQTSRDQRRWRLACAEGSETQLREGARS